jgi:hydroxypyruvate isomerase
MSMMGEDVVAALESGSEWLGYVHLADMPGRHEPGSGVIDFPAIIAALGRLGYVGTAGLEFSPSLDSIEAAAKARECFPSLD